MLRKTVHIAVFALVLGIFVGCRPGVGEAIDDEDAETVEAIAMVRVQEYLGGSERANFKASPAVTRQANRFTARGTIFGPFRAKETRPHRYTVEVLHFPDQEAPWNVQRITIDDEVVLPEK